ncbi:MAG: 2,3-bisphosphoglycerate-dependent phosphoglycerate mutase [Chlamydiota bacterium]
MSGKQAKLILLRHGQSEWNRLNLFTGWVDIPLSPLGIQESFEAGKLFAHLPIDVIYVSTLVRAQTTAMLAMANHSSGKVPTVQHPHEGKLENWGKVYSDAVRASCIPVYVSWHLNERMYGRLQGMNKQEMIDQYGADQVHRWRRSFDEAPPEGESLAMTAARTIPYFQEEILPQLKQGKNVLISAHGNSLRSIVMFLDNLSKEQVLALEIPTGKPLFYTFSGESWSADVK